MAGKWTDTPKNHHILAVQPFCRPFSGHFRDPPEKWLPAISPAIFGSGPVSHSVAGQPSLKAITYLYHLRHVWGYMGREATGCTDTCCKGVVMPTMRDWVIVSHEAKQELKAGEQM